ncbi:hypothetical protein GS471_22035, partial [Rhodococcus hoagii]|nr:hypothetical protein [Prescottella equi]
MPFLDVDTTVDNKWFVDPHAIRLHGDVDPFAEKANKCTETFFDEVLHCMSHGDRSAVCGFWQRSWNRGRRRRGLAKSGFSGHGGAEDVGSWIWQALQQRHLRVDRRRQLKQIEGPPLLFIEGIDKDITSDIT